MSKSSREKKTADLTENVTLPRRRSAASVPISELRDRLERARAALIAVKRAPDSEAARRLETDLSRQIRHFERDIAYASTLG